MHATSARRAVALTLILGLIGAFGLQTGALAKRGKRAVGVVSAYDGSSLTVEMRDGSVWDGSVAERTKVKLERRGRDGKSNGDLDDIEVGDKVLKLKARGGVARFIRVRKANSTVEDAHGGECKEAEEVADEIAESEDVVEEVTPQSQHRSCADKMEQEDKSEADAVETEPVDPVEAGEDPAREDETEGGKVPV